MPSKICSLSSLEVVVAQAAGEVELVGHRVGALAEERELLELVAEVGEEQHVRRGAARPRGGDAGQLPRSPATSRLWP